jgi:hypothetical protein
MASQPNRRINTGKPSEQIFQERIESLGGAVFRLRDQADLHGLNKGKKLVAFGQPSDFLVVAANGVFLAEVKSSNNKTSFPLSCFTAAQKVGMAKCQFVNGGKHYRIYIHNMVEDKWYIMDGGRVVHLIRDGVKSIKWNDLKLLRHWIF